MMTLAYQVAGWLAEYCWWLERVCEDDAGKQEATQGQGGGGGGDPVAMWGLGRLRHVHQWACIQFCASRHRPYRSTRIEGERYIYVDKKMDTEIGTKIGPYIGK